MLTNRHFGGVLCTCFTSLLAAIAVALPSFTGNFSAAATEAASRTITITGLGEAPARPDMAVISAGVITEAKTARSALDENSRAMAEVIATLRAQGLSDKDLQTSGFGIDPRYVYPKASSGRDNAPRIVGYTARNRITAKIRDLKKLGTILDAVVSAGSNRVDGISFTLSDSKPALNEARKAAVEDAKQKAVLYTDAAGVKIGAMLSISETRARASGNRHCVFPLRTVAIKEDVAIRGDKPVDGLRGHAFRAAHEGLHFPVGSAIYSGAGPARAVFGIGQSHAI